MTADFCVSDKKVVNNLRWFGGFFIPLPSVKHTFEMNLCEMYNSGVAGRLSRHVRMELYGDTCLCTLQALSAVMHGSSQGHKVEREYDAGLLAFTFCSRRKHELAKGHPRYRD